MVNTVSLEELEVLGIITLKWLNKNSKKQTNKQTNKQTKNCEEESNFIYPFTVCQLTPLLLFLRDTVISFMEEKSLFRIYLILLLLWSNFIEDGNNSH